MVNANLYKNRKLVACLDLSSSKLMCIIANIGSDGIDILGYSHQESKGIIAGAISDIKLAQKAIANVVAEAEKMAGLNIDEIFVAINDSQLKSSYCDVSEKIHKEVVQPQTIKSVVDKARIFASKNNRIPIHIIPLQYCIDDSDVIDNPRYMSGNKLHARFHILSSSPTIINNIENCFKRCKLSIDDYISSCYATSIACLKENERKAGVLLIDIGSSSTNFCIIIDEKIIYSSSISLGGLHITKDIATIIGIKFISAEKVKILNSTLILSPLEEQELINYRSLEILEEATNRMPNRLELSKIIQYRLEEILEVVIANLQQIKITLDAIPSIVITGGVANTVGIDKLIKDFCGKNTRIGYPPKFENHDLNLNNLNNNCILGMMLHLQNNFNKNQNLQHDANEGWLKKFLNKFIKE
jgi:cell division protein FtsA